MVSLLANPAFSRYLIAGIFVLMGILHFLKTSAFIKVMPAYIPFHRAMVWISGAAERSGGIGLIIPQTMKMAAIGLIVLLFCVFPANIDMAIKAWQHKGPSGYTFLLWARLPLQFVLMYWIYWAGIEAL